MASTDEELQNWFDLLEEMQQVAKNISNDTADDLGVFSEQEVAKLLPNDQAKSTFQEQMNQDLVIADKDIKNSKTFTDLMNTAHNHLASLVAGVFQDVVHDTGNIKDFLAKLTKPLYTSEQRQTLVTRLESDMSDQWFPGTARMKEAELLSQLVSSANKVSDSVAFVSAVEHANQKEGGSQ